MRVEVLPDKVELGAQAAEEGARALRAALNERGEAYAILATGASQFEMLSELVDKPGIDWTRVTCFHLDEYIGLSGHHAASFCRYLRERFVEQLPHPPRAFHYLNGEANPTAECQRLADLIRPHMVDVAFIGIGENGHLAFNDPPANFETEEPYLIVELDEACRRQQLGEGWFASLEAVPRQAISMSVRQILKAREIVCSVPDTRKAEAVQRSIEGPVTPLVPASILQQHPGTTIFLDESSASKLKKQLH